MLSLIAMHNKIFASSVLMDFDCCFLCVQMALSIRIYFGGNVMIVWAVIGKGSIDLVKGLI